MVFGYSIIIGPDVWTRAHDYIGEVWRCLRGFPVNDEVLAIFDCLRNITVRMQPSVIGIERYVIGNLFIEGPPSDRS